MKKYTITDKEWESVLDKVQTLEKENSHLKGVIDGLERALTLYNVSNRRELLIAFFNHIHVEEIVKDVPMKIEPIVDEWLKSN